MPRYTFEHKKTEEMIEVDMPSNDLEQFKKDHPEYNQVFQLNIGQAERLGITKPPSDFQKYVLGRIANSVPKNRIREMSKFGIPKEV